MALIEILSTTFPDLEKTKMWKFQIALFKVIEAKGGQWVKNWQFKSENKIAIIFAFLCHGDFPSRNRLRLRKTSGSQLGCNVVQSKSFEL